MDSITNDESEAFYDRDLVLGDSTGLLSELNESDGEEEEVDEPSLSYRLPIKKEVKCTINISVFAACSLTFCFRKTIIIVTRRYFTPK